MTQIKVKEQLQNVGCPTVADTFNQHSRKKHLKLNEYTCGNSKTKLGSPVLGNKYWYTSIVHNTGINICSSIVYQYYTSIVI
jgi:hypothetical protein